VSTPVLASELAPIPDGYSLIDFSTAGTILSKLGSLPDGARHFIIQPSGANLYWRADGNAATAGVGIEVVAGTMQVFENQRSLMEGASFIGGSARVHLFG
jgi:hypothetical protein